MTSFKVTAVVGLVSAVAGFCVTRVLHSSRSVIKSAILHDAHGHALPELFYGIKPNARVASRLHDGSPRPRTCAAGTGVRGLTAKIADAVSVHPVYAQNCEATGCAGQCLYYISYPCGSGCRTGYYLIFFENCDEASEDDGLLYTGTAACGGCQCTTDPCSTGGGDPPGGR